MIDLQKLNGTDIYSYKINGEIDKKSMNEFNQFFKEQTENDDKLKILGEIKNFNGFEDFNAFIEGLKVDFLASGKIKKYALLTDKVWFESIGKIGDLLTPGLPVKIFDLDEKENAIAWLKN